MGQFMDGLVLPASVTDPAFPPQYSVGQSVPLRVDANGILQTNGTITGVIVGEVTADAIAFDPSTLPTTPAASVNPLRTDLNGRLLVAPNDAYSYVRRFNNGLLCTGRNLIHSISFSWGVAAPVPSLWTFYDNTVTGGAIVLNMWAGAGLLPNSLLLDVVVSNGLFIDGLNANDARITVSYRAVP